MSQRKFGNAWWVDITHGGVRYRKKSPDNSKVGAQAYEATLRKRLAEGSSVGDKEHDKNHSQSYTKFADCWFKTHVLVNNKPSMVARTKSILNTKLMPHFGQIPLNKITTLHVEQYKAATSGKGMANKTINNELSVLGKSLRDAKRWYSLESIPEIVMLKLPPVKYDFLSESDSNLLLRQLSGEWYDIVYVALKTGMRLGELRALHWSDVRLDSRMLVVRYSWCGVAREVLSPKGNKIRTIPLTDDVVEILKCRMNGDTLVFGLRGRVFSSKTLNMEIRKACDRAGLRKITCHVLRHSYASQLAIKGVPIVVVQRLLGHADISITMRYAHLSETSVQQAVQVIRKPYERSLYA